MAFPGTLPEIAEPTSQEIVKYLNQRRLPRTSINIAAATKAMREERILAALPKGKEVTFTDKNSPRQIVFGQCKVPGIVAFAAMEPDNSHMHAVVCVAGHEIEDIWEVYFDGARIDFPLVPGPSLSIVPKTGDPVFTDAIYLEKRYGTDDQAAQTYITSKLVGWTGVHVLYGIANAGLSLRWDPLLYSDGFPDISFIVRGMKCYDPRYDATSFTNNTALVTAAFITNQRYGLRYTYDDIDLDWLADAADYCGEFVGSEIRYSVNGYFLSSESRETILQELVNSMEGRVTYQYFDRKWKIKPAKFYSPKLTITLDDVISEIEISSHNDRASCFNGVQGTYLDPESDYEENDFPIVKNTLYAEQDGGEKLIDVRYPLINSNILAQRLSKIKIEKSRQGLRVSFTATIRCLVLTPGDNINLTIPKYGWSNKVFEVEEIETLENGTAPSNYLVVALVLKENAPGVYEWANGEETSHDLAPNTNLPNSFQVPSITGLKAFSGTDHLNVQSDGTVVSRIYCTFNEIVNNFIRAGGKIEVQYKLDTATSWLQGNTLIGDINSFYLDNVRDGLEYDIRCRAVNGIGSPGEWATVYNHFVLGKKAPPTVVQSISAVPTELGVDLRWTQIPDLDFSHYVLARGDDRENILLHSENYSESTWTKSIIQIYSTNEVSPFGHLRGSKIGIETIDPSPDEDLQYYIEQEVEVVEDQQYRVQLFLKPEEITKVRVAFDSTHLDVDLRSVEAINSSGVDDVEIKVLSNGFIGVSFAAVAGSSGNSIIRIQLLSDSGEVSFSYATPKNIILSGVQMHNVTSVRRYVRTLSDPKAPAARTIIANRLDVNQLLWTIQKAGSYDINILSIDTSGNESLEYASAKVVVTAPSQPQNLLGSLVGPNVILTWEQPASTQFTVEQYEVRDPSNNLTLDRVKGNLYQFKANWSGPRSFTVAAIDIAGNVGSTISVSVNITPPSKVLKVRTDIVDNNVLIYFDKPNVHTLPIEYYEVRKGELYESSLPAGETSRGFINIFETFGGSYRYWLVPYDTAGNQGELESIDASVSQPPDFILYDSGEIDKSTYDEFDNAALIDTESFYAPVVKGRTWAEHFEDNSMETIQDFIDAGYSKYIEPANMASPAFVEKKIDLGVVVPRSLVTTSILEEILVGGGLSIVAEILYSEDDISYESGGVGDTTILATNFRYLILRYTLTADNDKSISRFYEHAYRVQVKKQTDSGTVEILINPTRVPFNLEFLDINSIVLTPKGTSHKIAIYDFLDAPNPVDFEIYLLDKDGADISGPGQMVSWVAEGVVKPGE